VDAVYDGMMLVLFGWFEIGEWHVYELVDVSSLRPESGGVTCAFGWQA
jgi:hypothetical protein